MKLVTDQIEGFLSGGAWIRKIFEQGLELKKKYGDVMLEEARNHTGPYLTDAGCESCSIYYTKDGWAARFTVYSIAPYAVGEPVISIPTTIIPEPETLIARKK